MKAAAKSTSHRTQIYLPHDLYTEAKSYAQNKSISLAELIRASLEKHLSQTRKKQDKYGLIKLEGSLKGGPKDLARNLNKYLKEIYSSY